MNVNAVVVFCSVMSLASAVCAARPVARWDVIPYQRVSGVFKAGVCAFHEDGVKVEFAVNGIKTYTAEKPTFNDRTGVWEYTFPIDTSKYADGPVTLNAKAITLGPNPESFTLPELSLYSNGRKRLDVASVAWADADKGDDANDGTETAPVKTLAAAFNKVQDGGVVYLRKGTYKPAGLHGGGRKYWTTITSAPGVKRDDVEIMPGRPGVDKLHFKNLTLFCDNDTGKYCTILAGEMGKTCCWIDGCKIWNKKGRWAANAKPFGNGMRAYVTGGELTDMSDGPGCELVRDYTVYHITSDVWTGCGLVVNCKCWDVDPGNTGSHPDFYQSFARAPGWVSDVILYNVSGYDCRCQGLFGVRLRDSAFVNISFKTDVAMYSQWSDDMDNVLFAHVTLVDQTWLWRGQKGNKGNYNPKNVRLVNNLFRSMGSFQPIEDFGGELKVYHNAFYGKDRKGLKGEGAFGDDTIYVDREFKDEAKHHYALPAGSAALKHGIPLQCVPADINGKLYPVGPRPCGAYAQ